MQPAPTEQELRAFVGPKADYFLKSWRPALAGTGRASGFGAGPFLVTGLWFGYRKMYAAALVLAAVIAVETILELVVCVGILGLPDTPPLLNLLVTLTVAIVCGACANGWYLSHACRAISEVRSRGLPEAEHLEALARRGGTSVLASIGLCLVLMLGVIGATFVSTALLR